MARKNKTQVAVEEFEANFKNLVETRLGSLDADKLAEYFKSDTLYDAVLDVLNDQEEFDEEEEGEEFED